MVSKYAYSVNGDEVSKGVGLLPEDVIHLKRPDPLNDYYGLSPIAVAAAVGDLDNNAIKYLRVFFENNGIPGGFVQIKERNLTKEQKDDLRTQFKDRYAGDKGWHAIGVLDAEASYIEVGANPQKLNLASVFGETESRLCAAFGVPPIVVAVWIGLMRSTYANYETALKDLWVDTQSPKYRRIADKLTAQLAPEFGDDLVINFDLSQVEALQENREELRKFALEGWNGGLFFRNQALEMAGVKIIEGPIGDEYKISAGPMPPMNGEMQSRIIGVDSPLMLLPGERHVIPADASSDEPEWRQIHRAADTRTTAMRKAFMEAVKKTRQAIDEKALTAALNKNSPYEAELEIPWERLGIHSLEEDFLELLSDVHASAARATRIPDRQATAPKEKWAQLELPLEDSDEWAELRVAALIREIGDETKEAIRQIINRRFTDDEFTTLRAVRAIMSRVGLTRRLELAAEKVVADALAKDVPLDEAIALGEKKARFLHRFRAKMIARTEGIRAASGGQESVWREAVNRGILQPQQEQFWIVTPDDRLDEEVCAPMEGQRRRIGEAFTTGTGGMVMAPPAHPNCRCARGLV
jgi:HK97 family phage portal protein